jgi:predicted transposase YdaD
VLSDKLFYWLFQSRPELPALILEAQMGPDPGFLRRLYAESARLLQQEPSIHAWQVVVITPSRLAGCSG